MIKTAACYRGNDGKLWLSIRTIDDDVDFIEVRIDSLACAAKIRVALKRGMRMIEEHLEAQRGRP